MRILFLSIFIFIACAVGQAQIYTPIGGNGQRIAGFKVTRALTIPTDTLKPVDKSIDSLGTLAVGPDSLLYLYNGKKYNRVTGAAFNGILNQSTVQTGAVFNVDRGIITQASGGSTTTALPAALASPFTIAGGNGISTTANTGTVTAGRAGDISVRPGQGGNQNTAGASFGGGGRGGNIDITAGNGGLGNGSGMISGNGGTMTVQGGDAGPIGTGAISGEPGWLKLAGGSANPGSNGNGKSVFIIPGAGYGTGFHGDTYIGTSPALVYRGRALVGFTLDPSLITTKQIFQVNGTSWFKDTLTLSNIASKILKTDASGNVIPAVPGTDYLASLSSGNLTETGSSILTITGGTGAVLGSGTTLQVKQASTTQNGFLSSTDWNTFNGKLSTVDTTNISNFSFKVRSLHSAGTGLSYNAATGAFANTGVLTVNGAAGAITIDTTSITNFSTKVRSLFSAGGDLQYVPASGVITVQRATTGSNGTLSSTDWNTFNGKAAATGGTGYIQNQSAAAQTTSSFWISGTGISNSSFQVRQNNQVSGVKDFSILDGSANYQWTIGRGGNDSNHLVIFNNNTDGSVKSATMLFRKDSNLVGINNTNPHYSLDVGGTMAISARFIGRVIGAAAVNANEVIIKSQADVGYIQNQNATPQSASMSITGNAQIASLGLGGVSPTNRLVLPNNTFIAWKATDGVTETTGQKVDANNDWSIYVSGSPKVALQSSTGNFGIGTTSPTSTLTTVGSIAVPIRTITANRTLDNTDYTVLVNNTAAATITLPASSTITGRIYVIKKVSAAGNDVTLATTGGETIDGVTTQLINLQYGSIKLQSTGTGWNILAIESPFIGAQVAAYREISSARTLDASDNIVRVTAGTVTITLPTAASAYTSIATNYGAARGYTIVNDSGATVTISAFLNHGASTTTITNGTTISIRTNGTNWIRTN